MHLFQKQQNTSGYNSIPNAIATDDATAAAVPFGTTIRSPSPMMMTLSQRSKRMVAIAAGMLLVTGGVAVWLQEDGSYFRSSGGSLATEDGSITTDVMLAELGSETIALKEELALTLLDDCTGENIDPWATGGYKKCCTGLYQVLEGKPYRCESCQVKCEVKQVDKEYACGPGRKTLVCYPTKGVTGQVPVVFYNRDSTGWVNYLNPGNIKWLTKMAAQCLITIAPETSNIHTKAPDCLHDHDSALAFEFLSMRKGWEKWGITSDVTPDWSRIAAAGLSSGAHHIPGLQIYMGETHHIKMKAVLYGHGGSLDKKEAPKKKYKSDLHRCLKNSTWCDDVPAMFLTSTDDETVDPSYTLNWYKKLIDPPRVQHAVYAEVPTGGHLEPVENKGTLGVFNDYTTRFLACHLYDKVSTRSQVACAWIYGGGTKEKPDICKSDAVGKLVAQNGGRHLFYNGNKKC